MARKKQFQDTLESARDAAVRLLARREHAQREMRDKLGQRGYSPDVVDDALQDLLERDWLSDARYAASMARHRASQGKGPRWVRSQLQAQGVAAEFIELALNQDDLDWVAACVQLARRLYQAEKSDAVARLRQQLFQRGFGSDQIGAAVARLSASE